jgi:ParB-like chromosome segregation protein Spo0J
VSVSNLKAHPLSVRVYGEPTASEELLRSIREIGVVQPIVIDENNFILAGTSRHFAAVQANQTEIPAVLFKGSSLACEWLVLESNRQRVKLASQIGREYIERLRLESEFARLRMVEGGKNKGTPQLAEAGEARDKAAKAVNLGRTTAERLAKVVHKADAGQPRARKILAAVDAGELSITAAFHELEPRKPEAKPADCPVCSEHFSSMTDLKRHAFRVHNLEATQLKEAMGFENGEKDPRHNQPSPYADKSAMTEALRSINSLGWTSAIDSIRRLDDIASVNKSLLMGLRTVLAYVTGNTMNTTGKIATDGTGHSHFRSQQEWDTVDELISTLEKTISTLASEREELQQARNTCRKQFLDSTVLPETCPTGKRIYPSVDAVRKSGSKGADINGLLQTFQCRECGGVHIGDEQYILTSLENIG